MLHRFAAVLCSPVKTRTVVYNPFLMHEVQIARDLLEKNRNSRSVREIIGNQSPPENLTGNETDWKTWLGNLTMTPEPLPKFSEAEDFESFVKSKHLLLAEIFSPTWDRTLGSSRNLLVGGVQMKGCGLTLPAPAYHYVNSSGVYGLSFALKAFIYSGLMDTTVPLGSNRSISVQSVDWGSEKNPLGIYLRELKVLRIIQVGSELTQEELAEVREDLRSQLGISSARELFELFTAQLAAMVAIGGRANCSPDNILINGQFMDEETWFWPENLGNITLYFESEGNGGLEWEKTNFATSTFLLLRNSLHHIHKFANILFENKDVPHVKVIEDLFIFHMKEIISGWNPEVMWKEGLDLSENYTTEKFQTWLKHLETQGWSYDIEHFKDKGFGINLKKNRGHEPGLAGDFNRLARPDFWKIAVKLSKLSPENDDPEELNNMLQRLVGASGFVLPNRFVKGRGLVKNTLGVSEFLDMTFEKWPLLKNKKMDLTVWDGHTETVISDFTRSSVLTATCVPLYFSVRGLGEKLHVLPCMKTILTS